MVDFLLASLLNYTKRPTLKKRFIQMAKVTLPRKHSHVPRRCFEPLERPGKSKGREVLSSVFFPGKLHLGVVSVSISRVCFLCLFGVGLKGTSRN